MPGLVQERVHLVAERRHVEFHDARTGAPPGDAAARRHCHPAGRGGTGRRRARRATIVVCRGALRNSAMWPDGCGPPAGTLVPGRRRRHAAHVRRRRDAGRGLLDAFPHDLVELAINLGRRDRGAGSATLGAPGRRGRPRCGRRSPPACRCSRPTAAPSTTSWPTGCAAATPRWRPPSRAPAACWARRFTALAGSSDYFLGGVVSYANSVKRNVLGVPAGLLAPYGAVSPQVAAQWPRRAAPHWRHFALSVTGIAGPDGGTAAKPVGLVYLGCADAAGRGTQRIFPGRPRRRAQVGRHGRAAPAARRRCRVSGRGARARARSVSAVRRLRPAADVERAVVAWQRKGLVARRSCAPSHAAPHAVLSRRHDRRGCRRRAHARRRPLPRDGGLRRTALPARARQERVVAWARRPVGRPAAAAGRCQPGSPPKACTKPSGGPACHM